MSDADRKQKSNEGSLSRMNNDNSMDGISGRQYNIYGTSDNINPPSKLQQSEMDGGMGSDDQGTQNSPKASTKRKVRGTEGT